MLVIASFVTLLSLAEASLKTPRTPTPSGLGPCSATTPTVEAAIPAKTATVNMSFYPVPRNSSSSARQSTTAPIAVQTQTADLPIDAYASISAGTTNNAPKVTASPELGPPGANFHEIGAKFVQTTYWKCVTFSLETHCGWHEPILDAGAGRIGCEGGRAALRAGVVAGVVAGGLVFGM
ncbi:hypothetical protein GGS23DRAFT_400266 [Durotheca rogersii]|uniref:uncharacterized protein n=1 Tax=Durotheca rogersii TaxID=419775 RepID=UPI00221F71FA|nr:uncharacterized protein GGS23DRAFT_400266 [Durotheca rogersii]KAI5856197.1 hypothetical protein GGS23DRAFT_400266 [Durotheca rogersii]